MPIVCGNGSRQSNSPHNRFCSGPTRIIHRSRFKPSGRELPSGDGRRSLQVDGAYTAAAWKQSIVPFLQRAGDAVPELDPLLKGFQEEYRRQYFEQWQQFLAEFPQGETPWWRTREQRRQLALMLLDEQSPYNRLVDVTVNELKPLLPVMMVAEVSLSQAAEEQSTGTFVRVLKNAWGTVSRLWERPPPSPPPDAPRQEWIPAYPAGFVRCSTTSALKAARHI